MINFKCPECQTKMEAPDELIGKPLTCPKCKKNTDVPAPPNPEKIYKDKKDLFHVITGILMGMLVLAIVWYFASMDSIYYHLTITEEMSRSLLVLIVLFCFAILWFTFLLIYLIARTDKMISLINSQQNP